MNSRNVPVAVDWVKEGEEGVCLAVAQTVHMRRDWAEQQSETLAVEGEKAEVLEYRAAIAEAGDVVCRPCALLNPRRSPHQSVILLMLQQLKGLYLPTFSQVILTQLQVFSIQK
jgi:hypothetical protein